MMRTTVPSINARTHSQRQTRQIANSIEAFGFNNPVLIDEDALIIAGHGRVEAAKLLGMTEVPTVRLAHMSEVKKRTYVIADNRLAEKAGWDEEILAIEFQTLIRDVPGARPHRHRLRDGVVTLNEIRPILMLV